MEVFLYVRDDLRLRMVDLGVQQGISVLGVFQDDICFGLEQQIYNFSLSRLTGIHQRGHSAYSLKVDI